MGTLLDLIAVCALIWAGLSVIVGALEPGDALRRIGAALILLLVVPGMIVCAINVVIRPLLSQAVTYGAKAMGILAVVAAVAFIGRIALTGTRRRNRGHHDKSDEE